MEGPAYLFMACDGFSHFAFHIGVEPDNKPETLLKAVRMLMEHPDFRHAIDRGFTMVFDRGEELAERLEKIGIPLGGEILFHEKFHQQITAPLLDGLLDHLMRKQGQ